MADICRENSSIKKWAGRLELFISTKVNRRLQFDNAIIGNDQGDYEVKFAQQAIFERSTRRGFGKFYASQFNNNNRISFKKYHQCKQFRILQ
jgi:hypothetical protein